MGDEDSFAKKSFLGRESIPVAASHAVQRDEDSFAEGGVGHLRGRFGKQKQSL